MRRRTAGQACGRWRRIHKGRYAGGYAVGLSGTFGGDRRAGVCCGGGIRWKNDNVSSGTAGVCVFLQALFCCVSVDFCGKIRKMRYFLAETDGKSAKQSFAGYKNTAFLWEEPDTPECVFIASNSISYEICKEATKWQQAKKSE